ncbi:MAG: helix-turn-helix domain-containing protein [Sphaerochaetaceae bacterium]
MENSSKPIVRLDSETQLRIYMLPLRQKILRTMRILGTPVTAKRIADMLSLSPSSARHHLLRLREIGLVEHDHFEMVNGIRAEYLRAADVNVSIGTNTIDALSEDREALTAAMLAGVSQRFQESLGTQRELGTVDPSVFHGDFLGGIAHLSQEDAQKVYHLVREFLDTHSTKRSDSDTAWEFALIMYEVNR